MLDGARKFTFPSDLLEGNPDAALVCVPIPVLPYLRRFFAQMQSPYIWKTPEDFERAYPVFSAIEAQMTSACVSNITDSIDRLYRLMDNALNGTAYTADGQIITPEIPAAPANPDGVTTGLRRQLLDAQGTGPENTLRSINQSIWNLAGPAPGTNLTDLATAIANLRGAGPENTLRSINQSIWNLAGPAPGTNLTQIETAIRAIMGTTETRTLRDLYDILSYDDVGANVRWTTAGALYAIKNSLHQALYGSAPTLTVAALLESINNAVGGEGNSGLEIATVRGFLNNIMIQTGRMANCCEDQAISPLNRIPAGICANAFPSSYSAVLQVSATFVSPTTVAIWDFSSTSEFEAGYLIGFDADMLIKTVSEPIDWSGYKFFVASTAEMCGIAFLDPQRWPTNKWFTLPPGEYQTSLMFTVDLTRSDLKVYICPAGSEPEPLGTCPGATTTAISATAWAESVQTEPQRHTFDATAISATAWAESVPIQIEGLDPTVAGFTLTDVGTSHALCIAWSSSEPNLAELGVRVWNNGGSGTYSEVAATVAPISISTSGNSGALTHSINMSGYTIDEYVFVPFLSYAETHSGPHNVAIQVSYVDLEP